MTTSTTGDGANKRSGGFFRGFREILIIIVIAIIISFVIRTFFFRAFLIPSGSMEQTLQVNDRIFVNLLVDSEEQLDRGDVIVSEDQHGWLPPAETEPGAFVQALEFIGLYPSSSEQHLVKRIIGMSGDHITVDEESRNLVVNGVEIDEPYLYPGVEGSDSDFEVTVPEGKLWVRSEEHTSELQSRGHLVCRLVLENK